MMKFFPIVLLSVLSVHADMMNARLKFDSSDDIIDAGKSFALKTKVIQTSGEALVIDPSDLTLLQPTGSKGRILPTPDCLSGMTLTEMKELRFDFAIATPGEYETYIRARFPLAAGYNHLERMDDGNLSRAYDSSLRLAVNHDLPAEDGFLEPKLWHWVRNFTYTLSAGDHVFHWTEPQAWCGGCELDRIVLVKKGSGLKPEEVTKANRRLVRPSRAVVHSRPIRLADVAKWRLDYEVSSSNAVRFDYALDSGATWTRAESGRDYPATDGATLRFRLTFAADPSDVVPPVVYTHQFKVEKTVKTVAASPSKSAAYAGIRPQRIVPNKIVYGVGEKGWADIVFTNASVKAERAAYVVTDSWDIDGSKREICRDIVEMEPNAVKSVRIGWPGSEVRYGHEMRVRVGVGERAEYFAVNDQWWRVAMGCGLDTLHEKITPLFKQFMEYYGLPVRPPRCTAGYRLWMDAFAREGYGMGPFPGYQTLLTRWQMQLCSVGGNKAAAEKPAGEIWYSSTEVTEARDSGRIREDTAISHSNGVHHTRYTVGFMEGPYGFEVARKHPEFLLRNDRGQPSGNYQNAKVDPIWISEIGNPRQCCWTFLNPDFSRDDTVEWALQDLAAGIDGFGEDGVYWDGQYFSGSGYDSTGCPAAPEDPAARRARKHKTTRRWYDLILKDHPERFAWMNVGMVTSSKNRVDPVVQARSGSLLEYQWSFLLSPSHPSNSYRGIRDEMGLARDSRYLPFEDGTTPSKTYFVGYLLPTFEARPKDDPGQYREVWTMAQHVMSLLAANAAHPIAAGPQMRNFKQLMMRYSEFYWGEAVEVMEDGRRHFQCDSLREVWYENMIYRRDTKDYTDYMIHLVNVPESERCREDVMADPTAVDDAVISTKLFDAKGVKAWAVKPYEYLDPVLEPQQAEVLVKSVNGEIILDVPAFRYYTLLVVRVPKKKGE